MKKGILGLITLLTVTITFGQQTENLKQCNCKDIIDQITPQLNGTYERNCNGLIIEKGAFINGSKHGEWVTYSRNSVLIRKLNYDTGALNGKVMLFYLNGKPKLTGQFEKGNKTGKWTYYTKKGKILSEGNYLSNKPIKTWIINDKKGKKLVVSYDYSSKKHLVIKSAPIHKDGEIIENENTEEFYILRTPDLKETTSTKPLGGYRFANFMFTNLVEVPVSFWDTYLYRTYKASFNITPQNEISFELQPNKGKAPDNIAEFTFLILTNPASKIRTIDHSSFQLKLLDYKIKEAVSLMPPWIYEEQSDVNLSIHYVINKNLH